MPPSLKAVAPDRSLKQRFDALARANEVRTIRARYKQDVAAGLVDVRLVLQSPGVDFESMKVFELILSLPKIGRVKANKILSKARVSPSKTVGGLSPRQLAEIVTAISPRCAHAQPRALRRAA